MVRKISMLFNSRMWGFKKYKNDDIYLLTIGCFEYLYFSMSTKIKKMYIMSHVPGSGKSAMAEDEKRDHKLYNKNLSVEICSTDQYFVVNNEYKFDASKLGHNHQKNQQKVEALCKQNCNVIIVDNTNTTFKEQDVYVRLALEKGYEVTFLRPYNSWSENADECFKRNNHGVPLEIIKDMLDRLVTPEDSVAYFSKKYRRYLPKLKFLSERDYKKFYVNV